MRNLRRYHRDNFTVREARKKAREAFTEELAILDATNQALLHPEVLQGMCDRGVDWSRYVENARECWRRYADRVVRIAGACGLTTSEVLGDLPRWPDQVIYPPECGRPH